MISDPTQDTRRLAVFTCLGKDVLLLRRFSGQEQMSGLFEFRLEMLSKIDGLDARQIVGTNVTFVVRGAEGEPRYFNGFVSQFSQIHTEWFVPTYTATVVPWLWFLTQTADCRIFQNRSTPQIVEQVFGDLGFRDFSFAELRENYPPREYCVQYRETDFAFVSRLLEEEGIAYRFQHADGRHTMICSDSNMLMQDLPEAEVDFADPQATGDLADQVTQWNHAMQFRSGRWSQTDYDFQLPVKDLMVSERTTMKTAGAVDWEVYEYPGRYVDKGYGSQLTRVRMQQQEAEHDLAEGSSTYRTFTPGGRFRFRSHRSPAETGREYLTTSVSHRATVGDTYFTRPGHEPEGFSYENQFQCIPSAVTYRPPLVTKRPVVEGPQTAVVVGPPGEEVYPDEFGRVKVQFHWDREGDQDDKSSCWMRVSQVHAGQGWGNIDLPRIGEEVIVSFLEGDPDRPIIKGRVYNAHVMPPFGLPAAKTRSGGKTNTHKGSGYNEMTMDDTAGQEQIRVNAQKDMDTTIGNSQTLAVGVDRTSDIGNNDSLTVGVDKSGEIGNDAAVTVGNNTTYEVANDIVINAGTSITLQCGASKIHMNQAGVITISGVFVTSAATATQSILAPITTITGTSVLNQLGAVCFQLGGIAHIKAGSATIAGANVEVKGKAQTVIRGAPIAIGEAGAPLVIPFAPPAAPGGGGPAAPAGPASTASAAEGEATGGAGAAAQAAGAGAAVSNFAAGSAAGSGAGGAGDGEATAPSPVAADANPQQPSDTNEASRAEAAVSLNDLPRQPGPKESLPQAIKIPDEMQQQMDDAMAKAEASNHEWGSAVVRGPGKDGKVSLGPVTDWGPNGVDKPSTLEVPEGHKQIGTFHAHPEDPPTSFSQTDIGSTLKDQERVSIVQAGENVSVLVRTDETAAPEPTKPNNTNLTPENWATLDLQREYKRVEAENGAETVAGVDAAVKHSADRANLGLYQGTAGEELQRK